MLRGVVVAAVFVCAVAAQNYRPIIGILTLPNDNAGVGGMVYVVMFVCIW